jgi:hypothetical protein
MSDVLTAAERAVADAPPLSAEQVARLAALLWQAEEAART